MIFENKMDSGHDFKCIQLRKMPFFNQNRPFNNPVDLVEIEDIDSGLADACFWQNQCTGNLEMVAPFVSPGVEKPLEFLPEQNRPDIGAFVLVAINTGAGQIGGIRRTAMF